MTAAGRPTLWRRVAPDAFSAAMLVLGLGVAALALPPVLRWMLIDATFPGTGASCDGRGACWLFVAERLPQFLYGFYPAPERWRLHGIGLALVLWIALHGAGWFRRRIGLSVATLSAIVAAGYAVAAGGILALPAVDANLWGGLFVTLLLSVTAMVVSLPAGILLALARQARNPVLSGVAAAFVEILRGVPLLAILFLAVVLIPLFLPFDGGIGLFARVVVGLCLYASAYMAEAVRGALLAVPEGQVDAAASLGLGYAKRTRLVILPQAMRLAIPNIINIFIQVLKDSTLVLIVGVFDLLGMVHLAVADPKWMGHSAEGFVFAGAIFFAICFSISRLSLALERFLGRGQGRAP